MPRREPSRWVRRLVLLAAVLVLAAGQLLGLAQPASADPTPAETEELALRVARENCTGFALPVKLPGIEAKSLCERVVANFINPNNSQNVADGCRVALAPAAVLGEDVLKRGQQACVSAVEKVAGPARAAMEEQQERVASAVANVDCAMSEGIGCITLQLQAWLSDGVTALWEDVVRLLTADTSALAIIDITADNTDPTPGQLRFYDAYVVMGQLSLMVLGVLFVSSLLRAVIQRSHRPVAEGLGGVAIWAVGWLGIATLAVLVIEASDAAAVFIAGPKDADGDNRLTRAASGFTDWIDYVSIVDSDQVPGGALPPTWDPGSVVGVSLILLLLAALVVISFTLLFRSVAIVLMTLGAPLLLAMQGGPRSFREALPRAATAFVTVAMAKPLMVAGLMLGAEMIRSPEPGEPALTPVEGMLGAVVIFIAAFIPGILYKLLGVLVASQSGQRVSTGAGGMEQATSTATTVSRNLSNVTQANRMPQLSASGQPVGAGGAWTGGSAATAARAGGTAGGAALTGGGLLALQMAALAAGGGRAVSQWAGSQIATAGGALGDADPIRVPGTPHNAPTGRSGGSNTGRGTPQQPGQTPGPSAPLGSPHRPSAPTPGPGTPAPTPGPGAPAPLTPGHAPAPTPGSPVPTSTQRPSAPPPPALPPIRKD